MVRERRQHLLKELAVVVDPRTLARYLRGEPVRPMTAARIEAALWRVGRVSKASKAADVRAAFARGLSAKGRQ